MVFILCGTEGATACGSHALNRHRVPGSKVTSERCSLCILVVLLSTHGGFPISAAIALKLLQLSAVASSSLQFYEDALCVHLSEYCVPKKADILLQAGMAFIKLDENCRMCVAATWIRIEWVDALVSEFHVSALSTSLFGVYLFQSLFNNHSWTRDGTCFRSLMLTFSILRSPLCGAKRHSYGGNIQLMFSSCHRKQLKELMP